MSSLPETIDPQIIPHGRGLVVKGACSEAECQSLAERFAFLSVQSVEFHVKIKLISKDCFEVSGPIIARITQACVVTSAPIKETIESHIYERFVVNIEENDEIDVQDSSVEPMIDGQIPLQEAIYQFVGVEANPYPRAKNAPKSHEFGPKIEKENPFSKLKELKKD